jgi:hypothetical protein
MLLQNCNSSYKCYIEYLALKRHFTTEAYDYHKYNGKIKANFETLETRKDSIYFSKLAKEQNYKQILLANIVKNSNIWIGDILSDEGTETYLNWKKRTSALTYYFGYDIKNLHTSYKENFLIRNNENPFLYKLFLQEKISLETFSILLKLANTYDYWNSNIPNLFLAKKHLFLAKKYVSFLDYDKQKFSGMIREHVTDV